jgi:glycosyltransferase involved in cell wall biosynthesis
MFHVLVIDDIPTPYRLALFKEIEALKRLRLTVLFLASNARDKQWQLDLGGVEIARVKEFQYYLKSTDIRLQFTWGLGAKLGKIKPDVVVVGGYTHLGYWRALLYCHHHRVPLVLWSGTTPMSEFHTWPLLRLLKRAYVTASSRYFAYGSAAARFLEERGAPRERIHKIYNTTDLESVRERTAEERVRLGPPHGPLRFIFVGRLVPGKGVQYVLEALHRHKDRNDFHFRIVGEGYYRSKLEALVQRLGLADRVTFAGYVQQNELPQQLAGADVFVFPTVQEVWGIVVNEALAAGLFVLSSTLAGVTEDLIDTALTGLPIDPHSSRALDEALSTVFAAPERIRAGRDDRARWVMRFSANEIARDFVAGVEAALRPPDHRRRTSAAATGP